MLSTSRTLVRKYALRIPILSNLVGVNPTGLVALPLEISIEIMRGLEWDDVLRMRRVCKYLCEVSKSRPVWHSLFVKYSQSISPPQPLRPDKPIQTYSSSELEAMVLRWKAGEIGWTMDGRVPPLERPLYMDGPSTGEYFHLVRGGRWLLISTSNGSVEYYDLDVSQPVSRPLIPPPFEEYARVSGFMSVDMNPTLDEREETLTFNVGLCPKRWRDIDPVTLDYTSPSRQCIQIWRVVYHAKDGLGMEGLHAHCLASFPEESIAETKAFDLRGKYVAYSAQFFFRNQGITCSVVVDWSSANGTATTYKRKYISGALGVKLSLLPADRLFVSYLGSLQIYDLLKAAESDRPPSQHGFPPEQPLWETELETLSSKFISGPFFIHGSSRFVMMDKQGLQGLIIPDTYPDDPEIGPEIACLLQDENTKTPLTSIWISTATIIRKVLEENTSGIPLLSKLVKYIARQRGLLDLPLEIKLEILKKLEWKDILLVRQTCRQLAEVTRERPIWLCLFSKHLLSTPPYRLRLERPIVEYSSVELENIVLRWHRAEIGWTSDGRMPFRERELQIDDDIHRALYLVPGGRWLLVATRKGTVDYYDLDTPNPSPRVLVPPQFGSSADAMLHMSVDVDMVDESGTDCLPLSFNVGLLHQRRDIHPDTQQIQIWQVAFKVKNEDNESDSLYARCLSDFPDEYVGQPKLFLLSGPHVAYTARSTSDFGSSFVAILNWTSLDGGDLNYRRRYISLRDRIDTSCLATVNSFDCEFHYSSTIFDVAPLLGFCNPKYVLVEGSMHDPGNLVVSESLVAYEEAGLMGLPLELLIEIMKQLEWDDILRVRQTCKQLYEASKARPMWLSLFLKYSQSISPPQPFRPDKPIWKYSSSEFETLVLHWKAAEIGWMMDGRVPPLERPLYMNGESSGQCLHLVRGGRWLLISTSNGSIEYYDLDVSQPASRPLVPPHFEEYARVSGFMSVDMEPTPDGSEDTDTLTFNVGLYLTRWHDTDLVTLDYTSPSRQCIQIWRVAFQCKENSRIEGLVGTCLAMFPEESIADTEAFDLRGKLVVGKWHQMTYKRKYLSGAQAVKLSLLPGDRLFGSKNGSAWLYDFLGAPESDSTPSQREFSSERPVWEAELPTSKTSLISGPFLIHDSSRFLMIDEQGLQGLIIPDADFDDEGSGPTTLCLLKDENSKSQHPHVFGYHRGIGVYLDDIILLQYRWPDGDHKEGIAHTILSPNIHPVRFISLDEYSGRSALYPT
ncbi:hypothetical protein NLJ89_g9957 [Agrocybe chaxingu]|uniref:F-box domain-containing protein n=1 Tax=Agrocybe chaxingu TaxID=84603 RepID=A0A9W8JSL8_9AGAR|nr:hypothetical protein NLJ89_g9957 [Agrocybe chaxingu]